jgi:diguanylate cyclase (GGDEF)-like protein/PAS domain S-box-containing protein
MSRTRGELITGEQATTGVDIPDEIKRAYADNSSAVSWALNPERTMHQSERKQTGPAARLVLESIADAVIVTDAVGKVSYVNLAATALMGSTYSDICGQQTSNFLRLIDEATGNLVDDAVTACILKAETVRTEHLSLFLHSDGRKIPIDVTAAPMYDNDGSLVGVTLVLRDVSATRELFRKMSYQATHDGLTRLVNRQEFERRLERLLRQMGGHQEHALLYMDMDHFKSVNDSCGHAAGDELLKQVANIFSHAVRQRDTLARLGGDEFGLLLEHCPQAAALSTAGDLRYALEHEHFSWQNRRFKLGVSIGLVSIIGNPGDLTETLSAADRACYLAKTLGRNHIYVHQSSAA